MRTIAIVLYDPPWVEIPQPGNNARVPRVYERDPIHSLKYLSRFLNSPLLELHASLGGIVISIFSKHKDTADCPFFASPFSFPSSFSSSSFTTSMMGGSVGGGGSTLFNPSPFGTSPSASSPFCWEDNSGYPKCVSLHIKSVVLEAGVRDFDQYLTAAVGGFFIEGNSYVKEFNKQLFLTLSFPPLFSDFVQADNAPYTPYVFSSDPFPVPPPSSPPLPPQKPTKNGDHLAKIRVHRIPKGLLLFFFF